MEKLIIIAVIIGASIIHSWIKRKQEEAEARESDPDSPKRPPPPLPPQQRGQGTGGWEEELRRLLQGDAPTPPPVSRPKPPVAPPVIIRPPPEPAAPRPFLARTSIPVPEMGREMEVGLSVRPVSLDQASAAHERASHLQAAVVQRMQETMSKVSGHTIGTATTPPMRRATNASRLQSLLRQKESQRTIILASVILGPPRGIES